MGRIEALATRYQNHISAPWQRNLAAEQRVIFIVYPKVDERKVRARVELFEMATIQAGHKWKRYDLTNAFAHWMAATDYRDIYFEEPDAIMMRLQSDFLQFIAGGLRAILTASDVDEDTVVAVQGVASLYGFTRVSLVLQEVVKNIRGRLVLFFPGEYEHNNYRLLDARDGWNYLAVPITLHNGMGDK
jgi:bacteriophage exclusion system BrxB-like protein